MLVRVLKNDKVRLTATIVVVAAFGIVSSIAIIASVKAKQEEENMRNQTPIEGLEDEKLGENSPSNKITILNNNISLTVEENEQVVKSVDRFMNRYRLPKGVQNEYTLLIKRRIDDLIEVRINPYSDASKEIMEDNMNYPIYLQKTDDGWQQHPDSGLWCVTLEQLQADECY